MTVSRVVNKSGRVLPATRDRVEHAMRELGYIPNLAARSLVVNKLGVIALVIPDVSNPFFPVLARGAEAAAREAGYTVILGNTDEDFEEELAYIKALCSLRVDGALVAPCGTRSKQNLELLNRHGIPLVLIDRDVKGAHADVVRGESRKPARALTEHLIEHGHTRIGLITGPADVSTAHEREQGYRDAIRATGQSVEMRRVCRTAYTRLAGRRAAEAMLADNPRPTAVVTGNNFQAFGVLDAVRALGYRVPEDLAVVTFDDVEIVADAPFFTCAAQPAEAIGRAAVEQLVARLNGDESPLRKRMLHTEVRIRRSCGCR
jgi:LacI family transcriptional regulator, galactose operon repressor